MNSNHLPECSYHDEDGVQLPKSGVSYARTHSQQQKPTSPGSREDKWTCAITRAGIVCVDESHVKLLLYYTHWLGVTCLLPPLNIHLIKANKGS